MTEARGDAIEVRGLRVVARHGVLDEERRRAQPFEVDLTIESDLAEAARTDSLSRTVDYGSVTEQVAELVTATSFSLLEALAGAIADLVLAVDGVHAVTVTVRKLNPPIAADVASVGVTVRRRAT